jgi:hypothetical protein
VSPGRRGDGRGWAYAGAVLGGVVSTLANVAHSYVPPAGAPTDWTPRPGAVLSAVVWSSALFVAVEILARTAWPAGRRWVALRYLGLLPVALVAAVVSYRHLSGLLRYYGEDSLTATIGPLAVDGLMTMATAALVAAGHRRPPADTPTTPTAAADPPRAGRTAAANPPPPVPAVPAVQVGAGPGASPAQSRPLRLPPAMRDAVAERARQAAAEGRPLTVQDVRTVVRVPEQMAAQILRDLATAGTGPAGASASATAG